MDFSNTVVTNQGRSLLTQIIATGANLRFTKAAASNQKAPTGTDLHTLSDLTGTKTSIDLIGKVLESGTAKVQMQITNETLTTAQDYFQVGIWADDNAGGEILFALTQADAYPLHMVANTAPLQNIQRFSLAVDIGSLADIIVEVNPNAYVTQSDMIEYVQLYAAPKVHTHVAADITDGTSVFAPIVHTHVEADITDLQSIDYAAASIVQNGDVWEVTVNGLDLTTNTEYPIQIFGEITFSSVDGQKVSVNGQPAIPLQVTQVENVGADYIAASTATPRLISFYYYKPATGDQRAYIAGAMDAVVPPPNPYKGFYKLTKTSSYAYQIDGGGLFNIGLREGDMVIVEPDSMPDFTSRNTITEAGSPYSYQFVNAQEIGVLFGRSGSYHGWMGLSGNLELSVTFIDPNTAAESVQPRVPYSIFTAQQFNSLQISLTPNAAYNPSNKFSFVVPVGLGRDLTVSVFVQNSGSFRLVQDAIISTSSAFGQVVTIEIPSSTGISATAQKWIAVTTSGK